jgi:hypothetical protein
MSGMSDSMPPEGDRPAGGPPPPGDQVPPTTPPPGTPQDAPGAPPPPGAPGGYQQPGYPPPPAQPVGVVPQTINGPFNNVGLTILLMIVTCGVWGIFWTYRTNEDLKKYNGDGLGGVLGVVIYLLISLVLMFTIPDEISKMYQRDGRESPVSAIWGLWFLLPIIGNIIWYVKVQNALNDFWVGKGAATV